VITVEPPLQPELAEPSIASETAQTFSGTLTGADTVLPEPTDVFPAFVPPGPDDKNAIGALCTPAPPRQPESATPSSATDSPQMFTGTLTGAETSLPEATETLPALTGPAEANAAPPGIVSAAASAAEPTAAVRAKRALTPTPHR
jgi:hypothetical protein